MIINLPIIVDVLLLLLGVLKKKSRVGVGGGVSCQRPGNVCKRNSTMIGSLSAIRGVK